MLSEIVVEWPTLIMDFQNPSCRRSRNSHRHLSWLGEMPGELAETELQIAQTEGLAQDWLQWSMDMDVHPLRLTILLWVALAFVGCRGWIEMSYLLKGWGQLDQSAPICWPRSEFLPGCTHLKHGLGCINPQLLSHQSIFASMSPHRWFCQWTENTSAPSVQQVLYLKWPGKKGVGLVSDP